MRGPKARSPAGRDGRAPEGVGLGSIDRSDNTDPALIVNDLDTWKARIQADADAFLHRRRTTRPQYRGRR